MLKDEMKWVEETVRRIVKEEIAEALKSIPKPEAPAPATKKTKIGELTNG